MLTRRIPSFLAGARTFASKAGKGGAGRDSAPTKVGKCAADLGWTFAPPYHVPGVDGPNVVFEDPELMTFSKVAAIFGDLDLPKPPKWGLLRAEPRDRVGRLAKYARREGYVPASLSSMGSSTEYHPTIPIQIKMGEFIREINRNGITKFMEREFFLVFQGKRSPVSVKIKRIEWDVIKMLPKTLCLCYDASQVSITSRKPTNVSSHDRAYLRPTGSKSAEIFYQ